MIKQHFYKWFMAVVLVLWLAPYGLTEISMDDIEAAIIQQDYEKAKNIAQQRLDEPGSAAQRDEIRYYLGLCNLRLGRYEEARKIFNDLTKSKLNPKLRDKTYLGIFDSYYMDGQYSKAHKIIQRLLKTSPRSEFLSLIYLKFARANLKLAHWTEAQGYLRKIVEEFPESLEVHVAKQLLDEKQYFAVQVGAFIDRDRAEKIVAELQSKGDYAYIVETVDQRQRTFYRVRVGQLVLLENAQKLKFRLSEEGYPARIYP